MDEEALMLLPQPASNTPRQTINTTRNIKIKDIKQCKYTEINMKKSSNTRTRTEKYIHRYVALICNLRYASVSCGFLPVSDGFLPVPGCYMRQCLKVMSTVSKVA